MSFDRVLARVDDDLAAGRPFVASQRLTTLVHANPTDLDLRLRLAHAHHLTGNLVEEGRWAYLCVERDMVAECAFERAHPTPAARLHALRWPSDPADAATPFARTRLARLADPTTQWPERRRRIESTMAEPSRRHQWAVAASVLCALGAAALLVIGLVTVLSWI